MRSWRFKSGRFTPSLVAAILIAGCGNPMGGHLPPATSIAFDGGNVELELPPLLPGNALPLDGGASRDKRFGELAFVVTDHETRRPMPARVIFRPPPGSRLAH